MNQPLGGENVLHSNSLLLESLLELTYTSLCFEKKKTKENCMVGPFPDLTLNQKGVAEVED